MRLCTDNISTSFQLTQSPVRSRADFKDLSADPAHEYDDECYWADFTDAEGEGLDWRLDSKPWAESVKIPSPPGIKDWVFQCVFEAQPTSKTVGAAYYR